MQPDTTFTENGTITLTRSDGSLPTHEARLAYWTKTIERLRTGGNVTLFDARTSLTRYVLASADLKMTGKKYGNIRRQ